MNGSAESKLPLAGAGKEEWRTWARRLPPPANTLETGRLIAGRIEAWPGYLAASHVLVYLAFGHEPDLSSLLATRGRTFYTTRTGDPGSPLSIHELDRGPLERHPYGFLQPPAGATQVDPEVVDLVLVPGLAFDLRGNRLGFGQGFYDRLLSTLPSAVPRVGVASANRIVPALPAEPHDVRMTHLATETGVATVDD